MLEPVLKRRFFLTICSFVLLGATGCFKDRGPVGPEQKEKTGSICGWVSVAESGMAVSGAVVKSFITEKADTTNAFGYFFLEDLRAGRDILEVSAADYESVNYPVEVKPDKRDTLSLHLRPLPSFADGYVRDQQSNSVISGAWISSLFADDHDTTDLTGHYKVRVRSSEAGGDSLSVSASHYFETKVFVSVERNKTQTYDLALEPYNSFVEGIISDSYNQKPIQNAIVKSEFTGDIDTSDATGRFKIGVRPLGIGGDAIFIRAFAYEQQKVHVSVHRNETLMLDVSLEYKYFIYARGNGREYFDIDHREFVAKFKDAITQNEIDIFNAKNAVTFVEFVGDQSCGNLQKLRVSEGDDVESMVEKYHYSSLTDYAANILCSIPPPRNVCYDLIVALFQKLITEAQIDSIGALYTFEKVELYFYNYTEWILRMKDYSQPNPALRLAKRLFFEPLVRYTCPLSVYYPVWFHP